MSNHSLDNRVIAAASGKRDECTSALSLGTFTETTNVIWFIQIGVTGECTFNTYTVHIDFTPNSPFDMYNYKMAVYERYDKLSNTATAAGIGRIVPNTTLAVAGLLGPISLRNTAALSTPVTLQQGDYWIAFHPYLTAKPSGPLSITTANGINANSAGNTWVVHGHMTGTLATIGTLPTTMTTNGGTMTALSITFASRNSFWAGLYDNRTV